MNELKMRLIEFITTQQISIRQFEASVGLSNGYIKKFKGGISVQKLEVILHTYPTLSREWLLYGEGEMLKSAPAPAPAPSISDPADIVNKLVDNLTTAQSQISQLIEQNNKLLDILKNK